MCKTLRDPQSLSYGHLMNSRKLDPVRRCRWLVLVVTAWAGGTPAQDSPLDGMEWELVKIGEQAVAVAQKPSLIFVGHRVRVFGGCNRLMGQYTLQGSALAFEGIAGTMMACKPNLMRLEGDYTTALHGVSSYLLGQDAKSLVLSGSGLTLTFRFRRELPQDFVQSERKVLNVEPEWVTCFDDPAKHRCLQLEDLSQGVSWGRFTEQAIEGFRFEPGYRYQIQVGVERKERTGEKRLRLLQVVMQRWVRAVPQGKILEVAPAWADCVGVAPRKCLQVREEGRQRWKRLYDPIEGFSFEEGYSFKLVVREEKLAHPPTDASALKRTLVRLLEKTPVRR